MATERVRLVNTSDSGVKESAACRWPYRIASTVGRLLTVVLVICIPTLLLTRHAMTLLPTSPPTVTTTAEWSHSLEAGAQSSWSDRGRYRNKLISSLWVNNLPEHSWFTDRRCRHFVTRFACDDCLETVSLASFPRSGNTWTRYLIEASSGLFTCSGGPRYSNYRPDKHGSWKLSPGKFWSELKRSRLTELGTFGFVGEVVSWLQGNTIAAKTHILPQPWNRTEAEQTSSRLTPFAPNTTRRAIVIVRDPFKAFISLKKYGQTQSMLSGGTNFTHLFRGEEWQQFVVYYAQHWYNLNSRWLRETNVTHILAYERLVQNTVAELEDVLTFLHVQADPGRLECVRLHTEGRAHNRRHDMVPDDVIYPLNLRAAVWSHVHQLNSDIRRQGLRELPLEDYSFAEQFKDIGSD